MFLIHFFVARQPKSSVGRLIVKVPRSHTIRHTHTHTVGLVRRSDQLVAEAVIYTTHNKLTYLFTPWSRTLLEKLSGFQLVKKFPAFYGIRRFITAFTSVRHLSLS